MKYHTPLIDFEEYSEATKSFGEKMFFVNSFDKYMQAYFARKLTCISEKGGQAERIKK